MTLLRGAPQDRRAELRQELAPLIGERVVTLIEAVLAEPEGDAATADVTEAEALLLQWARSDGTLSQEASARFERTFSPRLRELLAEFITGTR
ncbi:MAG: hypothetical protein KF761_00465 [Salinibacterium sp.]|nr:hypothetical protein [Salinibacterium sp.]